MFTKTTTQESLAAKRAELEQLRKRRDELVEAAQAKRALHADSSTRAAWLNSPEGIVGTTDADLAREEATLKERSRDFLRADGVLRKFLKSEGENLDARFRELATREEEFKYGAARKALRARLAKRLITLAALAAEESEIESEAVAAGYQRGPIRLLSSVRGERTRFDVWRYDLCGFDPEMLSPTDPQRRIFENERARPAAA